MKANNTKSLKLNFNERSDFSSKLIDEFAEQNPSYKLPLWQYPDRSKVEQQLAQKFALNKQQVLCTNGGDEAIMLLFRLMSESNNGKIILPLPAFSQYTEGLESWQVDFETIAPNKDLTIDIKGTLSAIEANPNSVCIITRPNNPTGEVIDIQTLIELLETAKTNNSWVFLDEAYAEFMSNPTIAPAMLNQYDNLVILRTLSKAYGLAGIRFGYLLGDQAIIESFNRRCMPFNVSSLTLAIAERAVGNSANTQIREYVETINKNRLQLCNFFDSLNIAYNSTEANFVLMKLPIKQAEAVQRFLAKRNVLVRSFNTPLLEGCLRITIPVVLTKLIESLSQALCPELICFDMDGVLIDTSASYDNAVLQTVENLSGKTIELDAVMSLRRQGGFNNDWVLSQALLEQQGIAVKLDEVITVFQDEYLGTASKKGLMLNEQPLIDESLVKKLSEKSTPMSIVTGRPRKEAQTGRSMLGLENFALISLDDVAKAKPSPEGIRKLQKQAGNKSWMCGDNPDDMAAATASDSLAIGIATEQENANVLYQAGADVVLNSINELEDWLCPIQ